MSARLKGRDHTARTHNTLREMPRYAGEFAHDDDVPYGVLYLLAGAALLGLGLAVVWVFLDGLSA